jgi:predicted PilT family ATPase
VDVLAIERRDEAAVDPLEDLVGRRVGAVLLVLDLAGEFVEALRVVEEFTEQRRRGRQTGCQGIEEVEKAFVLRKKSHVGSAMGG